MKPVLRLLALIIAITSLAACGAPETATPAGTPTLTPTSTPRPATPTHTPAPAVVIPPSPGPAPATSTPGPDPKAATVEAVSAALTEVRGLSFAQPVQASFVSGEELASYLTSKITDEDRQELAEIQELYWTLGLVDSSVELYPLYLALLEEQVVGLYDPDEEELLVLADSFPLGPAEEVTLAHELVHALQQEHFNLRDLGEEQAETLDEDLALAALVEGDATFASGVYAAANLSLAELMALGAELPESPVFDAAPPVLQKTLVFPYETGSSFVAALWRIGESWSLVDQSYSRIPASTEQVLHPQKYQDGEAPLPVFLPRIESLAGSEWEPVLEDVLGEFMLRTYLESGLAADTAGRAAAGWGGDRFGLWRNASQQRVLVSLTRWDSAAEAREFFAAYRTFADGIGAWAAGEATPAMATWQAPDQVVLLALDQDLTLLVMAPDAAIAVGILSSFPQF